jgi:hypothetical protein
METKVRNMENPTSGNIVANQFILENNKYYTFQSYQTIIAKIEKGFLGKTILDNNALKYSRTTTKYLKVFLDNNLSTKEIQQRVNTGAYKTRNLNK